MNAFDRRPFLQARRDFRDVVSIPVMAWMAFSPARKTTRAYRSLLDIPLELSACGCTVTTLTDGEAWHINVTKEIAPGSVLEITTEARSYAACLFQLATTVDQAITDLERDARAAWDAEQRKEVAA